MRDRRKKLYILICMSAVLLCACSNKYTIEPKTVTVPTSAVTITNGVTPPCTDAPEPSNAPETPSPAEPTNAPETPDPAEPTVVPETPVPTRAISSDVFVLPVQNICQYPELPTGCEMTSLAIVLNYMGIEADKCDLADNYLTKGVNESDNLRANPKKAFPGDPRLESGYGCDIPVIKEAANKYIDAIGKNGKIVPLDYTEEQLSLIDLKDFIKIGYPVIVLTNMGNEQTRKIYRWQDPDGETVFWSNMMHCMVLIGFDRKNKLLAFADPMKTEAVTWYSEKEFEEYFYIRGCQAMIIYNMEKKTGE